MPVHLDCSPTKAKSRPPWTARALPITWTAASQPKGPGGTSVVLGGWWGEEEVL